MLPPADPSANLLLTRALATAMYPDEQWVQDAQSGVYVAMSRHNKDLQREINQAARLIGNSGVAFLLPEDSGKNNKKVDAVVNGNIVEMKSLSGNRTTIGKEFKKGFNQGMKTMESFPDLLTAHSVYLELTTNESVASVQAKLAGEIKAKLGNGMAICRFMNTQKVYYWSYDELRRIIGT